MKAPMIKGFGTLAAGLFAVLAAPAWAQLSTTANGPYYATPSWDQKVTTNRFVILANWNGAAVLDRETGLVWEQSPSTSLFTWVNASSHCVTLSKGGRKGWRLPTIQDLASLIDPTQSNPSLPSGHPFNVLSSVSAGSFYWSATSVAGDAASAWDVSIVDGGVFQWGKASPTDHAWCVRGGPGGDAQ